MSRAPIPAINTLWPDPILQPKEIGSSTQDEVFLSVGRALSKWESIESTLGMIFGHLVESDSKAAQRAYGSISNASGRKGAVDSAAEIYHDRHYKFAIDDLRLLTNHYSKASSYRNKIAHGIVVEHSNEKGALGVFLVPSFFATTHRTAQTFEFWKKAQESNDPFYVFGHSYRYTHEDIDFLNGKFEILREMLGAFFSELMQIEVEKLMQGTPRFSHDVRE